ncbi:outer membrane lipoprotein SlyB [Paenarthrobacter ilicis]|uniref:Uncharacterized protein n=1 Tax=Paenarthrobacter ilicis TaxID=43665 RepID=A0ABX0THT2_9MICC|nr:hypothetical protein [Paenarthrobacter ilicis]MBM7793126.1 outer membrane lipoprotein SlyB [Paenarthrobacter ilicis]NIJ02098.1 hypothetical protein [Paenarthrobacter ilicis]
MRTAFIRRWMLAVTACEAVGFMIPAAVGGFLALAAVQGWGVYPVMVVAGACEGALLGLGQSIGFGPLVVPRPVWVAATAVGAAVAWAIGMLPSTIAGFDLGNLWITPEVVVGAVLLLVSIPTLQWLVLRRVVRKSLQWIPINAGAWAIGILWTLAPSPFIDEMTPAPVLFASYALAGIFMAVTVAALTGLAAQRIALAANGQGDAGSHAPSAAW